jgi:cellobionic acid phosphorylase
MITFSDDGSRIFLDSPIVMPRAAGFLWNKSMMIEMNCRGFARAQFMQPEPSKYSRGPNIEAQTFMQPEQPYYSHHPGRFFYLRDEDTGEIYSLPYEPVRKTPKKYVFSPGLGNIIWDLEISTLHIQITLQLPVDASVELWSFQIENIGTTSKKVSIYPYFSIGYMSWMNQSATFRPDLGGIVATSITPYNKYPDYFKNKHLKDSTYFLCQTLPLSWHTQRESFEGEGGLHNPDALKLESLQGAPAHYETPVAVVQYRFDLSPNSKEILRFAFGPAEHDDEIRTIKNSYLSAEGFTYASQAYASYIEQFQHKFRINTSDTYFDHFVNNWLPRQIFYHGDVNRLTTDPQTRNYLQDNLGMIYIDPSYFRRALLHALSQQKSDGSMPDGILLHENAQLKYINQVPHTDHCVWLPICLEAYLNETNDFAVLHEQVKDASGSDLSVFERITNALDWLYNKRDPRGLSYIEQGDWNDPMNMVGYKGKGVSGWLTIASAFSFQIWSKVSSALGKSTMAELFLKRRNELNDLANEWLWDGQWYARGITDDDLVFGVQSDPEGKIFLNPQSWAILAGTCDASKTDLIIRALTDRIETPYGPALLAPAYTRMREDIGRVTQKFPGSAENGSVYNHAAIFYIYSLYVSGRGDHAFRLLKQMIPGPEDEDLLRRGQLPAFIPNYYRGAYYQFPDGAGKSSHLFNTGTVSWLYRCVIEGLYGLKGTPDGLAIQPQLPSSWDFARVQRRFRGAIFEVSYKRKIGIQELCIFLDGVSQNGSVISSIQSGKTYMVDVEIPAL